MSMTILAHHQTFAVQECYSTEMVHCHLSQCLSNPCSPLDFSIRCLLYRVQTGFNDLSNPSYPRYYSPHRRLRPLLQTFSFVHAHTDLRDDSRHLSRPYPPPGSLRVDPFSILGHPTVSPVRIKLHIFNYAGSGQSEHTAPAAHG